MSQDLKAIAAWAGVELEAPAFDIVAPTEERARGFVAPAPDRLDGLDTSQLVLQRVRTSQEGFPHQRLLRDATLPELFVVEGEGVRVLRGRARPVDTQAWLVDSAEATTVVTRDWLFDLEQGRVRAWPLTPAASWPGAAALAAPYAVADWLAAHADALGSGPSLVDSVAAAGSLARHWSAQAAADRRRAVEAVMKGGATVQDKVRAWLSGLGLGGLPEAATRRAEAHRKRVQTLSDRAVESPETLEPLLRSLVAERDALQSVDAAMRLSPQLLAPASWLDAVDLAWSLQLSVVGQHFLAASLRELLDSVARREPESWWAELA